MKKCKKAGVLGNRLWETRSQISKISKITSWSKILWLSKNIRHKVPLWEKEHILLRKEDIGKKKKERCHLNMSNLSIKIFKPISFVKSLFHVCNSIIWAARHLTLVLV